MNKNSLRFLQFRDTIIDVSLNERESGIKLPPIYKAFITTFKPCFAHQKIQLENGNAQSFVSVIYSSADLENYTIDDDELSLESFKDVNELFSMSRSNEGYLKDYVFIANHGYSGGLLVGIGKDNYDKIYHNTDSTQINYVAENIFF